MMMIEKPCDACLKRLATALDDGAILSAENTRLDLHCSHHRVGISAQVTRGLITDWGCFPAADMETMKKRIGNAIVASVTHSIIEALVVGENEIKLFQRAKN